MNVLPPHGLIDWMIGNPLPALAVLVGTVIALFAVSGLLGGRRAADKVASAKARRRGIVDEVAGRWQLLLLGATGLVLSLASGYTTWSGMTNFTGESTLSLMVTFGIQGVMLIVAWLIGESFATGMSRQPLEQGQNTGRGGWDADRFVGIGLAVGLVVLVFYWLLAQTGTIGWKRTGEFDLVNWSSFANVSAYFALGLILIAVIAFNAKGELSLPYIRSTRVIIKSAILWVMFLACMSTSVFFSFDSLFGAIFPKDERVRAANLRAQNQVAGIVADIGDTIERRRNIEAARLFDDKGWLQYEAHLTKLAVASQGAQREIEDYFTAQIEEKNRAVKQQQERIASAQSSGAGLQVKKTSLTDELARLKSERPALAAELTEKKTELENRAKAVDAKRVEAQAEDKGVEGSGKQGRGPMYRQRMDELSKMQDAYKIQQDRVRDAGKRVADVDTRVAQLERELAATDGELAKLKGEAETATQRIKMTEDVGTKDDTPRVDPARVGAVFERARNDFRQQPDRERLSQLQQQCSNLFGAMMSTPALKAKVRDVDCDPKQAAEASAVMFSLNDGIRAFESNCAGGDKLAQHESTDALYGFARKCLADSGLPSRETELLRNKINFADLSRDDKAHPFVATLNAFHDGNYLAYLALAIAIAMDGLVFMSGLFGANAVRSPLSDVPSMKSRSGKQLDAIIENALLPDTFDTARAVLNAMRPMTPHEGFTARVTLDDRDPHALEIRRVLNAAAAIGAVRQAGNDYEVRSELFEFLSVASRKAFHADPDHGRLAELRKVVTVALQPHVGDHADIVIHHCHPIKETNGCSAQIFLKELPPDDAFITRKVLNAGATLDYAHPDERPGEEGRYYIHKHLYKTLLMISAAAPKTGQRSGVPQIAAPQVQAPRIGGNITPQMPALGNDVPSTAEQTALPNFLNKAPPAVGQQQPEPSQGDDNRFLLKHFVGTMVEALGVESEAYLEMNHDVIGAAIAASDAFKALQHANPIFARHLDDVDSDSKNTVDAVHDRLGNTREAQERDGPAVLNDAYNEVIDNLSLISLLPGGPVDRLIRQLTEMLEAPAGAGRLTTEEQELLRLVRRLKTVVAQSSRSDARGWQSLQQAFGQPLPNIAIVANNPRRAAN